MRWGFVSAAVNIVLVILSTVLWTQYIKVTGLLEARTRHDIYTPAESVIEYKQIVFTASTALDRSPYQGSSNGINKAWEDLYNEFGISQISASLAAQLPNATMRNHNDPSKFIVQLDVFHQLHCLNLLRKLVYPAVFPEHQPHATEDSVDHLEHCYDQLRQSLMCHSDLATIYWQWEPDERRSYGNLKTTHTCKDFGKVRQWALENRLQGNMDMYAEVEDAPIVHRPKLNAGEMKDALQGHHGH